ncbi:hypothetical protein GCM10011575_17300 [Microlunatus endophyticus]|uniref:Uncharacterized protein n=1 Tax=Microlunatus endophyticus TaxID=1716077 RepID=A0A917W3G6_9ACTN|nr:hypothetical protein GCM10011575_17300 [Microlunatus endophyticus]
MPVWADMTAADTAAPLTVPAEATFAATAAEWLVAGFVTGFSTGSSADAGDAVGLGIGTVADGVPAPEGVAAATELGAAPVPGSEELLFGASPQPARATTPTSAAATAPISLTRRAATRDLACHPSVHPTGCEK